jgi:hypothetical protein
VQDELYALSLQSQPSLWVEPASEDTTSQETSTESSQVKSRKGSGSEIGHGTLRTRRFNRRYSSHGWPLPLRATNELSTRVFAVRLM